MQKISLYHDEMIPIRNLIEPVHMLSNLECLLNQPKFQIFIKRTNEKEENLLVINQFDLHLN
jgi:hypothetical protein